jgi:hypothetical protein
MVAKYFVVLFKDNVKRKIIKKFSNLKNAKDFFDNLKKKSEDVSFPKKIENGKPCSFAVGLIAEGNSKDELIFIKDEFGRNIKVKFDDDKFSLLGISPYNLEEELFDVKKKTKITLDEILAYLRGVDTLKVVYCLNNKVVIQKDDEYRLFSLKTEEESVRFIDILSEKFYSSKRKDCMFVTDTSTPQRKYLLKLLSENGFDKKSLYRKFTTFPRST